MMMRSNQVRILALKEFQDAFLNKWFWLYTIIFLVLSLGLATFGLSGMGAYGLAGYGRTTASLINVVMLIVPLMSLTLGAASIANEKERGTLLYLRTHPILESEILLGKYAGLALALATSLGLGFGLTGFSLGLRTGFAQIGNYLILTGLAFCLALVNLGLGLLISSFSNRSSTATGSALFLWLALVFLSDLGLLGATVVLKLRGAELLGLAMINPVQVFKLLSIWFIRGGLEVLGPAGLYAMRTYGDLFPIILGSILVAWIILPLAGAVVIFNKKGGL